MIEIFWPGEIRQLIAKYRADGTLNEKCVAHLNALSKKLAICLFIFALIWVLIGSPIMGVVFICLIPIAIRIDFQSLFNKQMAAYVYGKPATVKVIQSQTRWANRQLIVCQDLSNPEQKIIINMGFAPRLEKTDLPNSGQDIQIFLLSQKKAIGMPNISYLKEVYSLDNSIL